MVPFVVGLIYSEASTWHFLYTALLCFVLYLCLSNIQVTKKVIYAKEGFVIPSLQSWILEIITLLCKDLCSFLI